MLNRLNKINPYSLYIYILFFFYIKGSESV
nr:MAG TPA: hypothetical protein [Caudoviricetes sp.]